MWNLMIYEKNYKKHDNMNPDVMIYALKVLRNHEFSGQVCMLSVWLVL